MLNYEDLNGHAIKQQNFHQELLVQNLPALSETTGSVNMI